MKGNQEHTFHGSTQSLASSPSSSVQRAALTLVCSGFDSKNQIAMDGKKVARWDDAGVSIPKTQLHGQCECQLMTMDKPAWTPGPHSALQLFL